MKIEFGREWEVPSPGQRARYEKKLLRTAGGMLFLGGPGLTSRDGGRSWETLPGLSAVCAERSPGEVVSLTGGIRGLRPGEDAGLFLGEFAAYSEDGRALERFAGMFHLPHAAGMYDDGGRFHPEPFVDHGFLVLRDDLWVLSMYGVFHNDLRPENLSSYSRYPIEWGEWKYRTFCVASRDRGRTWTHLATVASGLDGGWEGFCEPALIDRGDGALVCLMRNGEHGKPGENLWAARSLDGGTTWTDVRPLEARGVYPQLVHSSEGYLVAGYGRPGWRLMLNVDGRGEQWSHHLALPLPPGSGYCALAELEAGRFLYVYSWDSPKESKPSLGAVEVLLSDRTSEPVERKNLVNSVGMTMVYIPWGSFAMGSPPGEPGRDPKEGMETLHTVTLSRGHYIARTPVTNVQYRQFCEETGASVPEGIRMTPEGHPEFGFRPWEEAAFSADELPVICVSWRDAERFCGWLSEKERRQYRLPTEAEWEHACRAGTRSAYWWGNEPDSARAHWDPGMEWKGSPAPAGAYPPNPWGLCAMLGNVGEWCQDTWGAYPDEPRVDPLVQEGGYRIFRGGGWNYPSGRIRCASRCSGKEDSRLASVGFRVVLEID